MDMRRYAHYWHRVVEFPIDRFRELAADVRALRRVHPAFMMDAEDQRLRGWDGMGDPTITDDLIEFNGDGSKGLHHETFTFPRSVGVTDLLRASNITHPGGLYWDFVKTSAKPYDLAVASTLILACLRLGGPTYDLQDPDCIIAIRSTAKPDIWKHAEHLVLNMLLDKTEKRWNGAPESAGPLVFSIVDQNILHPSPFRA